MEDLNEELIKFNDLNGPAILEIALVDNNIPPVGGSSEIFIYFW